MKPYALNALRIAALMLASLPALPGLAQSSDPPAHDPYLDVLRATQYFNIVRAVMNTTCAAPQLKAAPLCTDFGRKLQSTTNASLENVALPLLKIHMSVAEARATVDFWSAPACREVLEKMFLEMSGGHVYFPDKEELKALRQFDASSPGVALKHFQTDPALADAINRVIGQHIQEK